MEGDLNKKSFSEAEASMSPELRVDDIKDRIRILIRARKNMTKDEDIAVVNKQIDSLKQKLTEAGGKFEE